MIPPDFRVTTDLLWRGALLFALLDVALVSGLRWRLKPAFFRQLQWELLVVNALFWFCLWFGVIGYFWESVYRYVFPDWTRWVMPFFQAGLSTLVAALAWRLANRSRLHPVLSFVLVGGAWGIVSHGWAVTRGIVDRPPPLQGASPVAAAVIAAFEFMFYGCLILIGAAALHLIRQRLTTRPANRPQA